MLEVKDLWLRISNDDREAYSRLYTFYYSRFYNYGRKFTAEETLIEDSIQEVLLEIWRKRKEISSIEFPATYFYASFRHLLFRRLKSEKNLAKVELFDDEPVFSIDHIIIARETDDEVKAKLTEALTSLTPRQREAIFLRFYEELSYEEVAKVLDISVKATYKIIARALLHLKQQMLPSLILVNFSFLKTILLDTN